MHARRLFFALWPAQDDAARIMAWARDAHALLGGRIMRQDTLHLTLAFLGGTGERDVQRLIQAVPGWTARIEPITLRRFGRFHGPRVVWAGPDENSRIVWLDALHQAVWSRLESMGWQPPSEAFRPHVSLLRRAGSGDMAMLGCRPPITWTPEACVLAASQPDLGGSRYQVLARMRLA
ncbi:RNA 2',3'-cyclic phosphodiesterase [Allopusillimonas soli]|uniref:RNA 2',3'-cyclic phosphodiesterase n=1 Tax=Allopusillimonas soli TaxID=659016 RepID=A0A853FGL8_9BURK|nr:RNA 2',3'-cyclic phosphodiesterase [Allopusillimonas soli]NYT37940.1 RNA 2',3'-cyclic phosphodiesterase [Allopusillimonas soli]TEA73839.1 RNA 2',3'-cyclic phosphodiesterase [Allopusillimonas soli]